MINRNVAGGYLPVLQVMFRVMYRVAASSVLKIDLLACFRVSIIAFEHVKADWNINNKRTGL